MTDFKDIMSKRTDSELLEITTILRDNYQPEAVVAAEIELKFRNLTEEQFASAQQLLDKKKWEQEKKNEKYTSFQNKVADIAADAFNPLTEKSTNNTVQIVTIGLTVCFLVYLVKNWELIVLMLQDIGNVDISLLEFFAPLVLFPIGLFGFWTIRKYGWIILTIMLTYLTTATLFAIGFEMKWSMQPPIHFEYSGLIQVQEVENNVIDVLFNKKGIVFYVGQLILFVGLLVFLNKKTITEKYLISKRTQLLVVGLTAIPFIFLGLMMLI